MTRVDHEERVDNERVAQNEERKVREEKRMKSDREAFGKLLGNTQQAAKERGHVQARDAGQRAQGERVTSDGRGERVKQEAKHSEAKGRPLVPQRNVSELARQANASLQRAQSESVNNDRLRASDREQGLENDGVQRADREHDAQADDVRSADVDRSQRADEAKQKQAVEQAQSQAIDADERQQQQRQGQQGQASDDGSAKATADVAPANAKPEVRKIPPELLEKLVSTVYLMVNEKGLREFQIELKDGPLKGALMRITADRGKISLAFSGLGANEKNLVEASKGELMRKLESKGLQLARLHVG
jgi:hypothetical protein